MIKYEMAELRPHKINEHEVLDQQVLIQVLKDIDPNDEQSVEMAILSLLYEMKRFDTTTHGRNENFEQMFAFVTDIARALDYYVDIDPYTDGQYYQRYSCLITNAPRSDEPLDKLFHAHLDTVDYVDPFGNSDLFIQGKDLLLGRGTNDMLTQAAAALVSLAILRKSDLPLPNYGLVLTSDEERGMSDRSKDFVENIPNKCFIDLEPTGNYYGPITNIAPLAILNIPVKAVTPKTWQERLTTKAKPIPDNSRLIELTKQADRFIRQPFHLSIDQWDRMIHVQYPLLSSEFYDLAVLPDYIKRLNAFLFDIIALDESQAPTRSVHSFPRSNLKQAQVQQIEKLYTQHFSTITHLDLTSSTRTTAVAKRTLAINFDCVCSITNQQNYIIASYPEVDPELKGYPQGRHSGYEGAHLSDARKLTNFIVSMVQTDLNQD